MKVAILGGGVIGITSAYFLADAGYDVTVFDRQQGPAQETSFANAGEISPGYASPWAAPGIPVKALKWLLMKDAPLVIRPRFDPSMLIWLVAMLRNCTKARYIENKSRMMDLAEFSRSSLIDLREETNLCYDHKTGGTLQLFRSDKQLQAARNDIDVLSDRGIPFETLDRAGCLTAEPGLATANVPIVGGLRLPRDETGDCFKFTVALAELAKKKGVNFRFGTCIQSLEIDRSQISRLRTTQGNFKFDQYLIALGSYSSAIVRPLNMHLPVYPVKGYSITIPVLEETFAPVSTIMDETFKVAITRLGNRIRVGGMAEIAGFNYDLPLRRKSTLTRSLGELFPNAGSSDQASFWCGLRPMTPDGTPVIGRTPYKNLFLNTGHGTLGWTMACGSAVLIKDVMSDEKPALDATQFAYGRYRQ